MKFFIKLQNPPFGAEFTDPVLGVHNAYRSVADIKNALLSNARIGFKRAADVKLTVA
jgi:hypothetical protein